MAHSAMSGPRRPSMRRHPRASGRSASTSSASTYCGGSSAKASPSCSPASMAPPSSSTAAKYARRRSRATPKVNAAPSALDDAALGSSQARSGSVKRSLRLPPLVDAPSSQVHPLEQHRQLAHVDLDRRRRRRCDLLGKCEAPLLESLVDDREPAACPHEHLHQCPSPIEEDVHVTTQWVAPERELNLIGEPLERLPHVDCVAGDEHPHRTGDQEHEPSSWSRASSTTNCAAEASSR